MTIRRVLNDSQRKFEVHRLKVITILAIERLNDALRGRCSLLLQSIFKKQGKCTHGTGTKRVPPIYPLLDRIPVTGIIFHRHSNQRLAPLPMPLTVFI